MIRSRYKSQPSVNTPDQPQKTQKTRRKSTLKLPPVKGIRLNEDQISRIGLRVLNLKNIRYGPHNCSKSTVLEKVLLRKRIDRRVKTESMEEHESSLSKKNNPYKCDPFEKGLMCMLTPEKYIKRIYL